MNFKPVEVFEQIIKAIPKSAKGQMFGALCIKSSNNRVAAVLWKDQMLFKLDQKSQNEALKLTGSKIAAHLYDTPG